MLTRDDYRQIARIHSEGIFKGFLSSLGERFLSLLYESIDKSEGSLLLVSRSEGKIVGFVTGTRNIGEVYRIMLRSWGRLFLSLLPAMVSPKKIFRIVETVMFSGKNAEPGVELPSEELLSISVLSEYRGKGYAEELFKGLAEEFMRRKARQFKIVVGDALEPAHRFYKKMGARPVAKTEVHKGSGSIVYVFDVK